MLAAMAQEARVQADPHLRADRFVERWQGLWAEYRAGDMAGREKAGKVMAGMAKSLGSDLQMEAALRGRAHELGLERSRSRDLGRQLTLELGLGRERDRGLDR